MLVTLQDFLSRFEKPPGHEGAAESAIEAATSELETATGFRWRRATGLPAEFDLEGDQRSLAIAINQPNVILERVWEWWSGEAPPAFTIDTALSEYDAASKTGDYRIDDSAETITLVHRVNTRTCWEPRVRVMFSCGYDTGDNPLPACFDDLRTAIAVQAEFALRRTAPDQITSRSKGFGESRTDFHPGAWHPTFAAAVKRYTAPHL